MLKLFIVVILTKYVKFLEIITGRSGYLFWTGWSLQLKKVSSHHRSFMNCSRTLSMAKSVASMVTDLGASQRGRTKGVAKASGLWGGGGGGGLEMS